MKRTVKSKKYLLAACLGLALLVVAAFWPAFQAGFVYDDHRFILNNSFLDDPIDWKALFLDPRVTSSDPDPDIYRPLCTLSFHLERSLGNRQPLLHHVTGVALHIVNTLLVLWLLLRLLAHVNRSEANILPAFIGAALFAVHPLQVESVAWISSRGVLLSALFSLAALLLAFGRSEPQAGSCDRRPGLVVPTFLAVVLCLLSCLSKESGVMTGVFILIGWAALPGLRNRKVFCCGCGAVAAALLFMAFRSHVMDGPIHQVAPHGGDRLSGVAYGGYGCLYEIGLIFRPWFHNLDYQNGFFDDVPRSLVVLCAALYLLLLVLAAAAIRFFRLPALGVLFLAAAQFPTSSIAVTLRSLVNDRYLYVPLVGFALIAAGLFAAAASKPRLNRFLRYFLLAASACLMLESFDRSREWISSRSLWQALVETRPDSPRGRNGLSGAFLREQRYDEALEQAVIGYESAGFGTSGRMNNLFKAARALIALERNEQAESLLEQLIAEAESPYREENFHHMTEACRILLDLKIALKREDDLFQAAERLLHHHGELPDYLDQKIRDSLDRDG